MEYSENMILHWDLVILHTHQEEQWEQPIDLHQKSTVMNTVMRTVIEDSDGIQ